MRRIDAIVVILLVALLATIVILSIKNDKFFNEERDLEVSKTEKQDSIVLERINGLSIKVNETMLQMDSILAAQKKGIRGTGTSIHTIGTIYSLKNRYLCVA